MRPNPQKTADLVTFIEKILHGKRHFLCSDTFSFSNTWTSYFSSKSFSFGLEAATRGVLWNKVFLEISQNSQENRPEACNFIKKETLTQVFSSDFCEISKNTFFTEYLWTTASIYWNYYCFCAGLFKWKLSCWFIIVSYVYVFIFSLYFYCQ